MRTHLRVFAIAGVLFTLLPLLASLKTPIVVGRYWMIGAPALKTTRMGALVSSEQKRDVLDKARIIGVIVSNGAIVNLRHHRLDASEDPQ